jgi:hypothetical protein
MGLLPYGNECQLFSLLPSLPPSTTGLYCPSSILLSSPSLSHPFCLPPLSSLTDRPMKLSEATCSSDKAKYKDDPRCSDTNDATCR